MAAPAPSPLVSLTTAARMVGVGHQTLARMIVEDGWAGAYKSGRRYVIPRAAVERWLAGEHVPAAAPDAPATVAAARPEAV